MLPSDNNRRSESASLNRPRIDNTGTDNTRTGKTSTDELGAGISQTDATNAAKAQAASLSDFNIAALFKNWARSYKDLTSTTIKLILADTKLAAISLTEIIALAILASFAALGIWASLLALLAMGLLALGLPLAAIFGLFFIAHIGLLAVLLWRAKSTTSGLNFSATHEILTVKNTENHHGNHDSL